MSFDSEKMPYARLDYRLFFASQAAAGGSMFEDINLSYAFELDRIRLHMSGAHGSVEDFTVVLSHHRGSYFNQNILSQAMNGVQDVLYQADPPARINRGDTIHFSMVASAANPWGLEVSGWAITQAPRG